MGLEFCTLSQSTTDFPEESFEETLTFLSDLLERFVAAWECAQGDAVPRLEDFLPVTDDTNLRAVAIIELIKVDLEYRWVVHNLPKRLVDYAREFVELSRGHLPAALIYEEFHLRQQAGNDVDPHDYLTEFPELASELAGLLNLTAPYRSTGLTRSRRTAQLEELRPGERIDDFELLTQLGKGSFARVFLARQISMQRLVALKVSMEEAREAQTLAQFDHDFIVRVYDSRMLANSHLRLLYMQYLPGGTLQAVVAALRARDPGEWHGGVVLHAIDSQLESRGEMRPAESQVRARLARMTWPETVCWLGARICRGLHHAHRNGVLHRDIKPANVLLTSEGIPKLADFNISFSSQLAGASAATNFGGSLVYMSPEQLRASSPRHETQPEELDARSDIYAVGVVLWELLAGQRPFRDVRVRPQWQDILDDLLAVRERGIEEGDLAPLCQDCPDGLKQVLSTALSPRREDRWSTAEDFARQLELCIDPATRELLFPAAGSWRARLKKYVLPLTILGALIPNALAGMFNLAYNSVEIVARLNNVEHLFATIQLSINSVAFPLGLGLLAWLVISVLRGMRTCEANRQAEQRRLRNLRSRCLWLGQSAALIGLVEWAIAGVLYPLAMHIGAGNLPASIYLHFFGSLVLCGLIAASYPFFAITLLSVRVLYPQLLFADLDDADDGKLLKRLHALSWTYLLSAGLVPMLGMAALVAIGSQARFALAALSIGGAIGFAGAYFLLFCPLQADLEALGRVLSKD